MFRKRNKIADALRCEICGIRPLIKRIIPAMTIGVAIIIICWIMFDGPCRVSLFFKIPGGGLTITAYYILWFLMFAALGFECVLVCTYSRKCSGNKALLYLILSHMCMFIWYPLFFTPFSQFLSLLVIISAVVLLIIMTREMLRIMWLLTIIGIVKIIILSVFAYINLAFLIIN